MEEAMMAAGGTFGISEILLPTYAKAQGTNWSIARAMIYDNKHLVGAPKPLAMADPQG
jgi:hypothetical protein